MWSFQSTLLAILWTLTTIIQIILAFLFYNHLGWSPLCNFGWVILWISGILGILPIFTFKKFGGVANGRSYMETTTLVDKGIYAFVRHPQYLSGLFLTTGLCLITQHWLSLVFGLINFLQYYLSALDEETRLLNQFGDEYKSYMQRVPRFNFLEGIIRHIRSE